MGDPEGCTLCRLTRTQSRFNRPRPNSSPDFPIFSMPVRLAGESGEVPHAGLEPAKTMPSEPCRVRKGDMECQS